MKTYSSQDVAEKMLKKISAKNPGVEYMIAPHEGKFRLGTLAEFEALTAPPAMELPVEPPAEAATGTEVAAPVAPKVKAEAKLVELEISGAYESKGYIYTPPLNGKPRWFAVKGVVAFEKTSDGLKLTITEKAAKSRGFDLSQAVDQPAAESVQESVQAEDAAEAEVV